MSSLQEHIARHERAEGSIPAEVLQDEIRRCYQIQEQQTEEILGLRAVVAKIDDWFNNLGGTPCPDGERLARILDAAPESVLAERDAAKWVDPKPWWYPVSQSRTAHKLAQTNAVCRPRTRAEYEADEHRNGATHE